MILNSDSMTKVVGMAGSESGAAARQRLPAAELNRVTEVHVWEAVQRLKEGQPVSGYGDSVDYDLIADGLRIAPKAAFGLAATLALGFPVQAYHFSAGIHTPCFRILEEAGFRIVPKGSGSEPTTVTDPEAETWAEGKPRLVAHLRRERASGLAKAKKRAFLERHGKLFCEKCSMDPNETYETDGEACIEIHHHRTHVKDMEDGHRTQLDDLMCLCANCHRIAHARLKRD